MSRLSNFHLIFIFTSFSSPFHPHFHLTVRTSDADPASRCVCVEHLNRCKTSTHNFDCRGVQSTVETAPNEAIHLCWKQSLINSVYLRFQSLFLQHFVLWKWQAAKPITASPTFCCLYVCRNLHYDFILLV